MADPARILEYLNAQEEVIDMNEAVNDVSFVPSLEKGAVEKDADDGAAVPSQIDRRRGNCGE